MARRLIDCQEAADRLRISVKTVRSMAAEGRIPSYKVGGLYRIDERQLNDWLEDQATHTNQD